MRNKLEDIITNRPLSEEALHSRHVAQRQFCEARLGLSPAEIEKMVGKFVASRGGVTACPTAYAMPSPQYHLRHAA